MTKLEKAYNKAVMAYVTAFEKQTGLVFSYWIDSIGSVADFNNCYSIHFYDIKKSVEYELSKETVLGWYEYNLKLGEQRINLTAYSKLEIDFKYKKGFGFKESDFWIELDKF